MREHPLAFLALGLRGGERALALGVRRLELRGDPAALLVGVLELRDGVLALGRVLGLQRRDLRERLLARGLGVGELPLGLLALGPTLGLGRREPSDELLALGLGGGEARGRPLQLGLGRGELGEGVPALGVAIAGLRGLRDRALELRLGRGELRDRLLALLERRRELRPDLIEIGAVVGLDDGQPGQRPLALGVRVGGLLLGLLEAPAQHVRAADDVVDAGVVGDELLGIEAERSAARGLLGLARGDPLLLHAPPDVLARERRRVGVADDDEDAREAGAGLRLRAGDADLLDGFERAFVTQSQLLGLPRVCVARGELAQQRRELPAERERDGYDDEAQRAWLPAGSGRAEVLIARPGLAAHGTRELRRVGGRGEHLGDGAARELLRGRSEQRGDADAAFCDVTVGGAEDVAAVGEPQQHLLDVVVGGYGRGQPLALEAHASPIGRKTVRG